MAIFLTEEDVQHLLPMPEAIKAVEKGFREHGLGTAVNLHRNRVQAGQVGITMMVAALGGQGVAGFKTMGIGGAKVHLYDGEMNQLVAIMEARTLGQIRTGAASAVATSYMAREDASRVSIIGTGHQAETQLIGTCAVRPVQQVWAYSRTPELLESFCVKMSHTLGIQVARSASPQEAIQNSDIAIAITNVSTLAPVLFGEWVTPGTHLVGAGANSLSRRELDDEAITRCSVIVTDARDQAKLECADLVFPVKTGLLGWNQVWELGQVVTGQVTGRSSPDEITLYESQGIALEDVAVAAHIYKRAIAEGIGQELPL